jgi:hypothetical protein
MVMSALVGAKGEGVLSEICLVIWKVQRLLLLWLISGVVKIMRIG